MAGRVAPVAAPFPIDVRQETCMSRFDDSRRTTRRSVLQAGLALAALPLAGLVAGQAAAQEREFLFYSHDSEPAVAGIIEAFQKDFPKIKGRYVRLQNGALFTKVLAERSAGRYDVDVIQFSEPATAIDFQKRGGYQRYVSPQSDAYSADHLSNPVGDYFWVGVGFAGIVYSTNKVKPEDAPKNWKDLLNPKFANGMSVKQSTSGMQFAEWYLSLIHISEP